MGKFKDKFMRRKGNEWVDWLSDDSPPAEVHTRVHKPASANVTDPRERLRRAGNYDPLIAHAPQSQKPVGAPAVSIQVSLPEFHLPKFKIPRKQITYWSTFTVIVVAASIGTRALITLLPSHKTLGPQTAVKGAKTTNPDFKTVAPENKPDLAKGSSGSTAYDATRHVYSYSDTYLGGKVTVSQQQLPANFKSNPGTLAQVAASIGAKETFQTAFGTAYVATSSNGSSQRLAFIRQDLLIFIESDKKIDNDAWKFYIESLR